MPTMCMASTFTSSHARVRACYGGTGGWGGGGGVVLCRVLSCARVLACVWVCSACVRGVGRGTEHGESVPWRLAKMHPDRAMAAMAASNGSRNAGGGGMHWKRETSRQQNGKGDASVTTARPQETE